MPLPKNRSNSVRKIHVRTAKGHAVQYRRRVKGKRHSCAVSGAILQSVDSSGSRPNRKFGGTLSSAVSSQALKLASRVKEGRMALADVDVRLLPYVKGVLAKK